MAEDTLLDDELDQAERERAYAAEDRRYRVAQARGSQSGSSAKKPLDSVDQALKLAGQAPLPVYGKVAVGVIGFAKAHPEGLWLMAGFLFLYAMLHSFMIISTLAFVGFVVTHPFEILRDSGLTALGWVIELLQNFGLPSA